MLKIFLRSSVLTVLILLLFLLQSEWLKADHNFADVGADHWAHAYIDSLASDGVLDASKNTYRPEDPLNRAELVKLLVEFTTGLMDPTPTSLNFKDVQAGQWYHPYIETAYILEFVSGYKDANGNLTGVFGPADLVTRAEACKMVLTALGIPVEEVQRSAFKDVSLEVWYTPYVMAANEWGVVQGYRDASGELTGRFGPNDRVTRAQIAKMIIEAQNSSGPQ